MCLMDLFVRSGPVLAVIAFSAWLVTCGDNNSSSSAGDAAQLDLDQGIVDADNENPLEDAADVDLPHDTGDVARDATTDGSQLELPTDPADRSVNDGDDVGDGVDIGGEDCQNAIDDDGDTRVDCHDPDCFDTEPCEGVNPAPFLEPAQWRLTWSDEFNGPEPGNEACYDNDDTPPQCLTLYWHTEDCPEPSLDNLAGLNSCNWSVFYLYNWMDNGQPIGEGVNAFDPGLVTVAGGELILTAEPRVPAGGLSDSLTISEVMEHYDCGVPPESGYGHSTDCPIVSGGVWSKQMGSVVGLLQTYGRFEIRARLPVGPGSWPAHWMLPQEGPWPGDGEIDIMEAVNYQPDFRPFSVGANFHDGVEIETDDGVIKTHMSVGSMDQDMSVEQQRDQYHIYAVEWESDILRFYVDDHLIGTVREGTLLRNTDLATGETVGDFPLEVPDELFHMVLNSTVAAFGTSDYPDPRDFPTQEHGIDYVRAWELCDEADDHCPNLGAYDGANCHLGAVPARGDVFIHDGDLVYPAEAGDAPCPDGGERVEDLCVVFAVVPPVHTFIFADEFYIQTACLEATLSDSPSCTSPCGGVGEYWGDFCFVGSPPEGGTGLIRDGNFGYSIMRDGGERCPVGRDRGTWCEFGAIPEGRVGSVTFEGDMFLLDRICNPTELMPNCPLPCPEGARFDGEHCFFGNPPPDRDPFVYEGGFYYNWLDTEIYASRCPIGTDDSAHCFVGRPDEGWTPHIINDAFYVDPACGNVPPLTGE